VLEPAVGDVLDGARSGLAELPSDGLCSQLGAHLVGVALRLPDGAGQVPLLTGPGVGAQVDVDSPGVPRRTMWPSADLPLYRGRYWFRTSDLCRVKAALYR
jgi:hypothetical protein